MRRILRTLALGATVVARVAAADVSAWESRGDAFYQAGNYQRALLAYETALASDPDNKQVLGKYQSTFLQVWQSRKVEANAGNRTRGSGLNRMGALPPSPEPTPDLLPAAAEPSATTTSEAEAISGDSGPGPETIRVRKDGTIELNFGAGRGVNRLGVPRRGGQAEDDEGSGDEPEEDPGPKIFGGGQTVGVTSLKQGFEGSQGEAVAAENSVVRTTNYEISGVKISYGPGKNLHIHGRVKNVSQSHISIPRVYASIFDEQGTLRGRNFSYVSPGRNRISKGQTKDFDVLFRGFTDPVSSYKFEVIP